MSDNLDQVSTSIICKLPNVDRPIVATVPN